MSNNIVSAEIVINGIGQGVEVADYFPCEIIGRTWKAGECISKRVGSGVHCASGCSIKLFSNTAQDDPFAFDDIVDNFDVIFERLIKLKNNSLGKIDMQLSICIKVSDEIIPALMLPAEFVNKISKLNGSIDIDIMMK